MSTAAATKASLLRAEAELVLEQKRAEKAERIKSLGDPINLPGIALAIQIRGRYAWIAENTSVAKKIDLETGKTLQIFRGHTAPVTCLAFFDKVPGSGDGGILITGSWDNSIKLWNTETKALISSTPAHSDFVKTLLVIPSLQLLVSGSSDKIVRFWDLSTPLSESALSSAGSISAHTRPVEALAAGVVSPTSAVLYTGDTMGVIKSWLLTRQDGRWNATPRDDEIRDHRTGITEMIYANGNLWSASLDETVQVQPQPTDIACTTSHIPRFMTITHPVSVKTLLPLMATPLEEAEEYLLTGAGDIIRAYDLSDPSAPELVSEHDAHWHDVTALRIWMRELPSESGSRGLKKIEPWVISTSLDGTIRKWRLTELLKPAPSEIKAVPIKEIQEPHYQMSEEEERELAELMAED